MSNLKKDIEGVLNTLYEDILVSESELADGDRKTSLEIIEQALNEATTQVIQPYEYGHMERKATTLWLTKLPKLKPTNNVKEQMLELPKNQRERLHYLPPSKDRWKLRSETYQGIANAMAEQWGSLLTEGNI